MSNQKKQIILNEIAFWKKSKMLPEKYCDYLTMIYTEGNQDDGNIKGIASEAIKVKEKKSFNRTLLIIFAIAAMMAVALFTVPSVAIMITIVAVFTVGSIIAGFVFAKSKQMVAVVLQIVAAILLLALTMRIVSTYFENNNIVLYSSLALNCVFWAFTGWKMRLPYFTFSGILGIVALIGYWFVKM